MIGWLIASVVVNVLLVAFIGGLLARPDWQVRCEVARGKLKAEKEKTQKLTLDLDSARDVGTTLRRHVKQKELDLGRVLTRERKLQVDFANVITELTDITECYAAKREAHGSPLTAQSPTTPRHDVADHGGTDADQA